MAIDCVLCFHDGSGSYFINAYVTILSIFENTKEKVIVHILHDSTIEHGRKHLQELCDSYGQEIRFHHVEDALSAQTGKTGSKKIIPGTTYRYYIHEFVTAEKAIYMDCDVIVNRDILDLYSIPLGDRLFASTLDLSRYWKNGKPAKKYAKTVNYLGLKEKSHASAGLMLMNLEKLRELSASGNIFVQKTLAAINDGIELYFLDMDIVNSIAASLPDGVLILDPRFNLWPASMHLGLEDLHDTIFHYVSKPDKNFFPAHLLFWKYYAMTPFAGDMFERMSAAYCATEIMQFYLLNPRHRRHARELLKYGMAGMMLRAVGRKLGLVKK